MHAGFTKSSLASAAAGPLLAAVTALIATPAARAQEIPGEFPGVRPMGMGDAFTAVANDDNAIWTNPAGIARTRKARSRDTVDLAKFPNLIAGANADSRNFYDSFKGSADKNVEGVLANADLGGKPFYARGALFPVTIFDVGKNNPMAIGAYSNTTVQALVPTETPDTAQVTAVSDLGAVMTLGWTDDANRFDVGVSVRPVARYAYEDRIPSSDLASRTEMAAHIKEGSNRSEGLGIDAGMLYTVADFWYPTIGLSVLNLPTGCHANYLNPYTEKRETVCGDVYHGTFSNPDALSIVDPTDIRAGLSITPRITRKVNLRFSLDVHHIPVATGTDDYGLQGIEASKLVHAGLELFFGNPLEQSAFSVRTGYNQGFVTAGASLNLGILSLDFATYGVDVSTTSKPVEDRRYLASLSIGI